MSLPTLLLHALLPAAAGAAILAACSTVSPPTASGTPAAPAAVAVPTVTTETFRSGDLLLSGVVWRPGSTERCPVVLFHHGGGRDYREQIAALGRLFTSRGYALFVPYRRGHGMSADQGTWIGDLLERAEEAGGPEAAGRLLTELLTGPHLADAMAALHWLAERPWVDPGRIYVAGSSSGGALTVLATAATDRIHAAVDFAGAAAVWADSPSLREALLAAARQARAPILFVQAENDPDLTPGRELAAAMAAQDLPHQVEIFPAFGDNAADGAFAWSGGRIWIDEVLRFFARHTR